jgi:hypothetical protein
MADQYVGSSVLGEIIDGLRERADLVDVQIEKGYPGDAVKAEAIYPGEITADVDYPVMTGAAPRARDQMLTIPLEIRVASRRTLDDVHDRLGELIGAVDEYLAETSTLDDHPNVVEVTLDDIRHAIGPVPEGFLGFGLLTLTVHTRVP